LPKIWICGFPFKGGNREDLGTLGPQILVIATLGESRVAAALF